MKLLHLGLASTSFCCIKSHEFIQKFVFYLNFWGQLFVYKFISKPLFVCLFALDNISKMTFVCLFFYSLANVFTYLQKVCIDLFVCFVMVLYSISKIHFALLLFTLVHSKENVII